MTAAVLFLAGCSSTPTPAPTIAPTTTPATFDLTGGLVLKQTGLTPDAACSGQRGYSDITGGAPVTVYNAAGSVVAVGALEDGVAGTRGCIFQFTVADVPAGHGFYSYEITHRGKVTITEADARGGHAIATLGE